MYHTIGDYDNILLVVSTCRSFYPNNGVVRGLDYIHINNHRIFDNSEEYSVFHSRLHKLVLNGDYSKGARRIMYTPDPAMRGEDDPLIKFKSGEARILVTFIRLVSGYVESRFDESKVNLVIFMIFLWLGKAWLTMSATTVWPQGRALTVSQAEGVYCI